MTAAIRQVRSRKSPIPTLGRAHATWGRLQRVEVVLPRGQTSDTVARFVAGLKAARQRPQIEEA